MSNHVDKHVMSFCAENNNALRVVSPSQPLLVPCHTSTTVLFWYIAVTVCSKICKWVQCFQFCVPDPGAFFRDLPTLYAYQYFTHICFIPKQIPFFGALCNSISKNIFFSKHDELYICNVLMSSICKTWRKGGRRLQKNKSFGNF